MHFDLIVSNATVIDGTKAPRFQGDIAVSNGTIADIGTLDKATADREMNASGLIAAPGFIDSHTHDDRILLSDRDVVPKVSQGVTTVITGNCGISLAHSPLLWARPTPPLDLLDADGGWFRFPEFPRVPRDARSAACRDQRGLSRRANDAARRDHGPSLTAAATAAEIAAMRERVRESLASGAVGVSTGTASRLRRAPRPKKSSKSLRPMAELADTMRLTCVTKTTRSRRRWRRHSQSGAR